MSKRPINCIEKRQMLKSFYSRIFNPRNNKLYTVLWWIYHTIYIEQSYFCPWPWGNYGLRWAKETWTVNGPEGHLKFQMFQRLFVERKWQFSSLLTPIRAFIINKHCSVQAVVSNHGAIAWPASMNYQWLGDILDESKWKCLDSMRLLVLLKIMLFRRF